jgi:hypothetical protein
MIFDGDRDRIEPYLRELADLMGLKDWGIRLMDGTPESDDAFAEVQSYPMLRRADIRVINEWADAEPEVFRHYMAHELIHAHFEPLEQPLRYLSNTIGRVVFDVTYATYCDAEETAVDSIAVAWAKTLPLPVKPPPFPGKKTRKEVKTA